jgi:hypothetical protein
MYYQLNKNHCEKRADCIIDSAQLLEHKHKYDAKLYINLFTLEIVCFKCNLEILDEMFTTDPLEKLLKFKARVKDLITTLITKTLGSRSFIAGIRAFSTATISGIKHLGMPSLVYSYPVFFYLLWSVPYFRFVELVS